MIAYLYLNIGFFLYANLSKNYITVTGMKIL